MDLKKAYDRFNWTFLCLILLQIGLNLSATNWIMSYITSTNFFVLINGGASNFFKSSWGLRHVYPLSPLLFMLIVEDLSLQLKKEVAKNDVKGVKVVAGCL